MTTAFFIMTIMIFSAVMRVAWEIHRDDSVLLMISRTSGVVAFLYAVIEGIEVLFL